MNESVEDVVADRVVDATAEQAETSLDPAIEAAMRALDDAARLPVEERAAVLEATHRRLAEALDASPDQGLRPPAAGG